MIYHGDYVTVEKKDTLWSIAEKYFGGGNNYKQLAAMNNISNPNLIYIGQLIWFKKSSSGSSSNRYTNSNTPVIDHFGLQSDSDNTLFAMWTWNKSNTESYQVKWEYATGDGVWFVGSSSANSVDEHDPSASKQSTYSIPSNATKVRFKVKPVSKKHTVNEKEVSYWTANWSAEKTYDVKDLPPTAPSTPSVTINKFELTAELDNIGNLNATEIQFQVVRDNEKIFKTGTATITTGHVSFYCTISAGSVYKVRCRAVRDGIYSAWSEYSSNQATIPATPPGIAVCRAASETSVYLSWEFRPIDSNAKFVIEYTIDERYFDASGDTTTTQPFAGNQYYINGLETGREYFFRIRVVNDVGESGWSPVISTAIGTKPSAPTTWSSTTTAIVGEKVTLFWVHNCEDGSRQTLANLEIYVNGTLWDSKVIEYPETEDENEEHLTGSYVIDTTSLADGATIEWRVQTRGIINAVGDWSIQRVIDVYAPPTVEFGVTDQNGELIELLRSFPFYISAEPGPVTQSPLSYYIYVVANESYETIDQIGNTKIVNSGQEVYSKHFYTEEDLLIEMSPGNLDLENNIRYTVGCIVSMDSGLIAEAEHEFVVRWIDTSFEPNAEISIDPKTLAAYIRPYCDESLTVPVRVTTNDQGEYIVDPERTIIDEIFGIAIRDSNGLVVRTTTGEAVSEGTTSDGDDVLYTYIVVKNPVEDVRLSVYRREYDGSFVELATGLMNSKNTFVTDPHPALDYARYRVVSITDSTGAVGFYDLPGYPVNGKAVVIQWDEEWSNFDVSSEDAMVYPPWEGSMLKLPYNIDKSTNYNSDVTLIEYIGREHPVTYYGTQVGETETWSVVIPATDTETLYAIRRLAKWMGDVYVREPSGRGYWAKISVSYSEKHKEVTIPITFDITRVEGGA